MTNPTDHLLLKLYTNYGWGTPFEFNDISPSDIEQLVEIGLAPNTCYTPPDIHFSVDPCKHPFQDSMENWPDNLFDLLGEYQITDIRMEGKIILYEECIKAFGLLYYDALGKSSRLSRQMCISMVRDIVLWHELGHWITHWMPGSDGRRWDSKSCDYSSGSKDVHEGLAQLFTQYAIIQIEDEKERSELLLVFDWMIQHQASCYRQHHTIMSHQNFGWKACLNALLMLRILGESKEATMDYLLKNLTSS